MNPVQDIAKQARQVSEGLETYPPSERLAAAMAGFGQPNARRGPLIMSQAHPDNSDSILGEFLKMFVHPTGGYLGLKRHNAAEDETAHHKVFIHPSGALAVVPHSGLGNVANAQTLEHHTVNISPDGAVSVTPHVTPHPDVGGIGSIMNVLRQYAIKLKPGSHVIHLHMLPGDGDHKPKEAPASTDPVAAPRGSLILSQPIPTTSTPTSGVSDHLLDHTSDFSDMFGKIRELFMHPNGYLALKEHGADENSPNLPHHKVYIHHKGVLTVTRSSPEDGIIGMIADPSALADKSVIIHHPNGLVAAVHAGGRESGHRHILRILSRHKITIRRRGFVCAMPTPTTTPVHEAHMTCYPSGFPAALIAHNPMGLLGLNHTVELHPAGHIALRSEFPHANEGGVLGSTTIVHHKIFIKPNHALSVSPSGGAAQLADDAAMKHREVAIHTSGSVMAIPTHTGQGGVTVAVNALKNCGVVIRSDGHVAVLPNHGGGGVNFQTTVVHHPTSSVNQAAVPQIGSALPMTAVNTTITPTTAMTTTATATPTTAMTTTPTTAAAADVVAAMVQPASGPVAVRPNPLEDSLNQFEAKLNRDQQSLNQTRDAFQKLKLQLQAQNQAGL